MSAAPGQVRVRVTAWVALVATVLLWGSAFVAIRAALRHYSPEHLSLLRIATAALALSVFLALRRIRRPRRDDFRRVCATGLIGITAYQLLLNAGEVAVTAATASFLVAVAPVFAALLARVVLRERLGALGWAGVFIAFAGTAIVGLTEGGSFELSTGVLLVLGAALAQAVFFVLQKPLLTSYTALEVTFYAMWVGVVPLLAFGGGVPSAVLKADASANLPVLWLGVGASAIAFVTWAHALKHIPLGIAATALYLCPLVAAVVGWLVLGEVPGPATLLGGAVVLIGVTVVTRWGRSSRTSNAPGNGVQ